MVEMQLFGLAYKRNILALLMEFGRFTWSAARAGGCALAVPCWAELWAAGTAGGTEQEHAGSTFLVSARPGASWEGQSQPGLDLAQGRALLPRLFRCNPFSWDRQQQRLHPALSARPSLSSLPPFTPIFFPFTVTNVHKESAMKSVLVGVILQGIVLLAGNEGGSVSWRCACLPGQGAGCRSGGWRHEEEPEMITREECFYFEQT